MVQHAYKNWTQDRAPESALAANAATLAVLLRLSREDAAALRADLKEVVAARVRVSKSLQGLRPDTQMRGQALRRLDHSLERSEGEICEKIASLKCESARLESLLVHPGIRTGA